MKREKSDGARSGEYVGRGSSEPWHTLFTEVAREVVVYCDRALYINTMQKTRRNKCFWSQISVCYKIMLYNRIEDL